MGLILHVRAPLAQMGKSLALRKSTGLDSMAAPRSPQDPVSLSPLVLTPVLTTPPCPKSRNRLFTPSRTNCSPKGSPAPPPRGQAGWDVTGALVPSTLTSRAVPGPARCCPGALPVRLSRRRCGLRCPRSRSAGTPHRWSRCFHRNQHPPRHYRQDPKVRSDTQKRKLFVVFVFKYSAF